jgi:hypothetical protein
MCIPSIRLVTFDALYTIIVPRLPVHVQYSQTFAPFIGVLDPDSLRRSFRVGKKYFSFRSSFLCLMCLVQRSVLLSLSNQCIVKVPEHGGLKL